VEAEKTAPEGRQAAAAQEQAYFRLASGN
jgi:hypothetical protein